ncbi:methionyl-tRNA formyltransferase [Teredinibacter haidensis]|uniref:methionyl-tRNA formyltransferase n=1 Tax=Teredinibacter haidensis TaxID=2731755 RepID=UPI0009FABA95|nr:methionyl-tRNA formyltransferase [Teredinibacter haidensis]
MNILFAGTPEFAARHLQALLDSEHELVAVYTQPDRPAGRGKKLTPSPVKQLALSAGIPVRQPASLKSAEAQQELAAFQPDVMIVVAYGLLLPQQVLDAPKLGCLNVHASLLPRWRGAAPIQRAIEAGDTESGVTIMQMDIGLDTGDMLLKARSVITSEDNAASLHDKLAAQGPSALLETLSLLDKGDTQAEKQNDALANYAHKIDKAEAKINWREPAELIARKVRAFNPFPVCFTTLNGERLKIHTAETSPIGTDAAPGTVLAADRKHFHVACGEGVLMISRLQLPGKKAMSLDEFANGHSHLCPTGTLLGEQT